MRDLTVMSIRIIIFSVCLFFLWESPAFAKRKLSHLSQRKLMISLGSNFHFTKSKADEVTGANYDHKYTNPYTLNAGLGFVIMNRIYVGGHYEYWTGQRQLTLNGIGQTDTLKIQNIGGDIGWVTGNPRVYWILMGSVFYPLSQGVEVRSASTETYKTSPMRIGYSGRLDLGIKFNNYLAVVIKAGYRFADLGQPQSNNVNYLSNGDFSLSGPFLGLGLSVLLW